MKLSQIELRYIKGSIILCLVLFLSACAAGTYTFNKKNYTSSQEALAAHKVYLNEINQKIKPTDNKLGGSAAVVIPSYDTCVALGIKRTGHPQHELIDYLGKFIVEGYRGMAKYLEKRNIFDKVTIVEDKYPVPTAKKIKRDYDAVLFLKLVGPEPGQAQWFLMFAPNYRQVSVYLNRSAEDGYPRVKSWLDNIEQNLEEVKYQPKT